MKKEAEHEPGNKPVTSVPPDFCFKLGLELWLPSVRDGNLRGKINSFLPKMHLVMAFTTGTESKLELTLYS